MRALFLQISYDNETVINIYKNDAENDQLIPYMYDKVLIIRLLMDKVLRKE